MTEQAFNKVAEVGELSPGDVKSVRVGNDQILLANVEGTIYACDDVCTHASASLSKGDLDGDLIKCPLHGLAFNVTTGEVIKAPAEENLRVFQIRIVDQDILVGPANT